MNQLLNIIISVVVSIALLVFLLSLFAEPPKVEVLHEYYSDGGPYIECKWKFIETEYGLERKSICYP